MASVNKHTLPDGSVRWHVRWRELEVIQNPDGNVSRRWRNRTRSCKTRKAADALAREVELSKDLGERWTPEAEKVTVTLETLGEAYVQAAMRGDARESTVRFRSSMVDGFLAFAGDDTPVTVLSLALLERYAASLPKDGRKRGTRYRKLREVERMWAWAAEREEQFPGAPRPRRLTGPDADRVQAPEPVIATDVATWEDVDRMIAHLDQRPWHRRVALILRYHGLRVSQALNLHWSDVDLERRVLRLRAGLRGSKKGRTRVVPLHEALAEEMATWERGDGLVFQRSGGRPWRGDALTLPFTRAWTLAGVAPGKWGATEQHEHLPGNRAHARPTHAFRACFRSGLIRAGVEEAVALYLAGHSQGLTAAAYVPEDRPETSPFWEPMVAAMAKVPRLVDHRPAP